VVETETTEPDGSGWRRDECVRLGDARSTRIEYRTPGVVTSRLGCFPVWKEHGPSPARAGLSDFARDSASQKEAGRPGIVALLRGVASWLDRNLEAVAHGMRLP
jgi:hypothetical protein